MKKYWLPIILGIAVIVLFFMFKRQHHLYADTLALNHKLASEINHLQDNNSHLENTLQHFQQKEATKKLLKPTFMSQQKYDRQHWEDYIQFSVNDYKTTFLGGIKNLKLTVNNRSDYTLNKVEIQLLYYRANGDLYKKETIEASLIPSGKSQTLKAPNSRRGVRVKAEFSKITCREMNFCWDKNKKTNPDDQDPYRCNAQ